MKKIIFLAILLLSLSIQAQVFDVGIITGPLTTPQINAITSPQNGRLIGNSTTGTIWYYDGTQWNDLGEEAVSSVAGKTGAVTLVKADVGLANVDNTSDLNKPISTATQNAINLKANDADVVKLSGSQNITGLKTLKNTLDTEQKINFKNASYPQHIMGVQNFLTQDFFFTPSGANPKILGYDFLSEKWTIDDFDILTTASPAASAQTLALSGVNNRDLTISGGNTVTVPGVVDNEVTSAKIANGAITGADIADNLTTAGASKSLTIAAGLEYSFKDFLGNNILTMQGVGPATFGYEVGVPTPTQSNSATPKSYVDNAKLITSEEVTTTTYTPTTADIYKIKEMKNAAAITVSAPTGSYTNGQNMSFQQTGAGKVEFDFLDGITGANLRTTGIGSAVQIRRNGTDWDFLGNYESYIIQTAVQASTPVYDFNAASLSLGALASWTNDGSGITTAATQGTGGNQPTVIDEAGKKAVSFDGTTDFLTLGTPSDLNYTIGTSDFTVMIVRGTTVATTGTIFGDRDATDRNLNIGTTANSNFLVQAGSSGQFFDTVSSTGRVIYEVQVDGGLVDTYLEGVSASVDQTASGEVAQNEFRIGARGNDTAFYNGSIRRIIVWNRILTTQERTDIVAQLQSEN